MVVWKMMGTMKFAPPDLETKGNSSSRAVPAASGAAPFRQLVTSVPPGTGRWVPAVTAMILRWDQPIKSVDHDKTPSFGRWCLKV